MSSTTEISARRVPATGRAGRPRYLENKDSPTNYAGPRYAISMFTPRALRLSLLAVSLGLAACGGGGGDLSSGGPSGPVSPPQQPSEPVSPPQQPSEPVSPPQQPGGTGPPPSPPDSENTQKLRLLAATVQGTTLTMTFNRRLDPDSAPGAARFIIRITTSVKPSLRATGTRVDGKTVVVTLASAADENDGMELDYNSTGCGAELGGGGSCIQDLEGNVAPLIEVWLVTYGPPPPDGGPYPSPGRGIQGAGGLFGGTAQVRGQASPTKQPGLTAGGATAGISHDGSNPVIKISKGSTEWTTPLSDGYFHTAPDGWSVAAKLAPGNRQQFYAVTDIASATDGDYLAYGYWSKYTPDSLAASGFQTFFHGSMPYGGNAAAQSLSGMTATYTGGAAGVYNIRNTDSYGQFKADFELKASFGPGGSVTGSLTNLSHLTGDPAFAFGNINNVGGRISGNGFAGNGPRGGSWGGKFFGPSAGGVLPTGVAGWFERISSVEIGTSGREALMSGSFGAICSTNCN